MEFLNRNLGETGRTQYFYRVSEFVTTFGLDPDRNDSFSHHEEFKGQNLLQCRAKAFLYYNRRLDGLNDGQYFLPFASPHQFVPGKHSCFSITLSLVEYYDDDWEIEHPLLGEDHETMKESDEIETAVLKKLGYIADVH